MNLKPSKHRRSLVDRFFNFVERRSLGDRVLFHAVLIACVVAVLYVASTVSQEYSTDIPLSGSTITEGIIGTPRFVNPVLAITRADHDVAALIFDGLLTLNSEGELVPDVAESVAVSDNGRTYTITLRQDEFFHDGTQLTAEDVAFTINLIQNPDLKSPLRGDWEGVAVTVTNEHELTLSLPEAYAPFNENLTVGILPAHIWSPIAIEQLPFSEHNTSPIGSGLYEVNDITFSDTGLITSYRLTASEFAPQTPYVSTFNVRFFNTSEQLVQALSEGLITSTASLSTGVLLSLDLDGYTTYQQPLPRTFSLFYNQNRSAAVRDKLVRSVLSDAIDKEQLVSTVLGGFGIPTDSPVPPTFGTLQSTSSSSTRAEQPALDTDATALTETLRNAGWTRNDDGIFEKETDEGTATLSFTIATVNTDTFVQTAEYIQSAWAELGIPVTIEQYEQTDLVQSIIRPRMFTILLFGTDVGRGLDLYPFWHSSQREDPGLNIAQYTNIDTDAYLTTLRTDTNTNERALALEAAVTILREEQPATFLYTPTFAYVVADEVTIQLPVRMASPSDRFSTIAAWHSGNESLWPLFTD